MRGRSFIAMIIAAAVITGCTGPTLPSGPPAITGHITSVSAARGSGPGSDAASGVILVQGSGTVGDKASITVLGTTPVLRQAKDGAVTSATFADLEVGTRVSVWVDGPVAESYPVQATASVVAILPWLP